MKSNNKTKIRDYYDSFDELTDHVSKITASRNKKWIKIDWLKFKIEKIKAAL